MSKKGRIKRVFPGGNTAKGFYSYYEYIVGSDATKFFIIKGGPGVGKSSFMKKIALDMLEKGYDVEFHQCSSDNGSLDGIVITDLKIGIIDGTAPHVVDPKHPGAVDEILNFGDFWDEEGIRKNRENIVSITADISKLFKRAYRFLAAAKSIRDDMEVIYEEALDIGRLNFAVSKLKNEILSGIPYNQKEGKARHLFGSAFSPDGMVDYYDTILDTVEKIIYVNGYYVNGISKVMEEIVEEASKKGLFVEVYHEPMIETNIETVLIPDLNLALTSSGKYSRKHTKLFDFEEFMDTEVIDKYEDYLEEDKRLANDLIARGLANIGAAKKQHDILEDFYIPNMNFKEIDKYKEEILNRIMEYAKEKNEY